ncbi:MAG: hypothetical protein ACK5KQ_01425 [Anaerorhabdus sp.]
MSEEKFDQKKYTAQWTKENMRSVSAKFKKDLVNEFRAACEVLEISQSQIFKKAMKDTIDMANKKMGK